MAAYTATSQLPDAPHKTAASHTQAGRQSAGSSYNSAPNTWSPRYFPSHSTCGAHKRWPVRHSRQRHRQVDADTRILDTAPPASPPSLPRGAARMSAACVACPHRCPAAGSLGLGNRSCACVMMMMADDDGCGLRGCRAKELSGCGHSGEAHAVFDSVRIVIYVCRIPLCQ